MLLFFFFNNVFRPNMTLLMFIWKMDLFKIVFVKYDFSRYLFAWKSSFWKTTFDSFFFFFFFINCWRGHVLPHGLNWKDNFQKKFINLKIFFCKDNIWSKYIYIYIYINTKTKQNNVKVVFCKDDFYINFFEITRESCLYKR